MKDNVTIFIFRRDLRVCDNVSLVSLIQQYPDYPILPIFIFNPNQINSDKNKYYSNAAIEFMIESLIDLDDSIKGALQCFYGDDVDVLKKLIQKLNVHCIAFNRDFTPFALKRDSKIDKFCETTNIPVISSSKDYTLFDFEIKNSIGKAYEVFTPFYLKCLKSVNKITKPVDVAMKFYTKEKLNGKIKTLSKFIEAPIPNKLLKGGRSNALDIVKQIESRVFANYEKNRNFPAMNKTTKLSAYLKFGCVSIREVFYACLNAYGINHGLIRELIWREFYCNITFFMPHVLQGQTTKFANRPMRLNYDHVVWKFNETNFNAWCQGKTGFPIVDAAMICMNETGYMHNRLRMIVASFLTKDLLQDWRLGEKYFATKLIDYDPSSNNGGWQWVVGIGADAQPYFRVMNPWLQSEKFDRDCVFIKTWIRALSTIPSKSIHHWYKDHLLYKVGYPMPIVDHNIARAEAIKHMSK